MMEYMNLHFALDNQRAAAADSGKEGPRVLILGPDNAGKTSLTKLLAAYATRTGQQPVVVNLDNREGVLSLPGTVSAAAFKSVLDVEDVGGWGNTPMSGPSLVPVKLPLVYSYALPSAEENSKMYKAVVSRLGLAVQGRIQEDRDARAGGCVVDTPGVISQGKNGFDVISHIISDFSSMSTNFHPHS